MPKIRSPQEEVGHGAGEGAREGAPQWGSRTTPPVYVYTVAVWWRCWTNSLNIFCVFGLGFGSSKAVEFRAGPFLTITWGGGESSLPDGKKTANWGKNPG